MGRPRLLEAVAALRQLAGSHDDDAPDAGFTNTGYGSSTTLLQALSFQGGPAIQDAKNILLRAAAAAYLNSFAVDYPLSTSAVVSMVNAALASNDRDTILDLAGTLDDDNNLGCPLN